MEADVADAYLVKRAQEGYLDAYSELVDRHSARAYRVAFRMLGNHHDAQDVAQDSLVVAWQQLPRFRHESTFTTWLYQIVTRRCLNRITRTKRTTPLDLLGDVGSDDGDNPAAVLERDLTVDAVSDAIAKLPPAQRIVVVLHHLEGLPYLDVARVTGSTEPAVRSHLFRARRTLGKALEQWR